MYSSKHATTTTAASESDQTYAGSKILGNQENAGFGTACANQRRRYAFSRHGTRIARTASRCPHCSEETSAHISTCHTLGLLRRRRGEARAHKRQIRPHGKQTIAVMIPAMPYFVVTSWFPAAHIANTARDQAKSRSALLWPTTHQAERR